MPMIEPSLRWADAEEHRYKLAEASRSLLHGAHNEVHDLTLCAGNTFSRFPQDGGAAAGAILSFADLGGAPAQVRATTFAGHSLVVGDIAVINEIGAANYDSIGVTVTAINTVGTDFDYEWTNGLGGGTGQFWQGYSFERIGPDTQALIIGASLNGLVAIHTTPYILQTADVGYIRLDHASNAATDQDLKVILFGD